MNAKTITARNDSVICIKFAALLAQQLKTVKREDNDHFKTHQKDQIHYLSSSPAVMSVALPACRYQKSHNSWLLGTDLSITQGVIGGSFPTAKRP